ncbi:hypothetical protein FZEAL_6250 [Fusarium zealandicum]|uniref:Aminoglycoside phosphotransferase domain-containing protein n=1 Tax=Fusarium zealandicum TaxID=1053134 RepID=A0A8H4UIX2_9HYPO|nr:hypothetical protein FZEAL_6250 [Fusarium zealandicum]
MLIADGQLYPQFPVNAYLVYKFLKDKAIELSDDEHGFFLKHVDDKGDHLMVDEDPNIIGIIDWQMSRLVPRREAFGLSLVSADMRGLCNGSESLSANDVALSNALREKSTELASYTGDGKMRRFFWGLALETEWSSALPLANGILQAFGEKEPWDTWKEEQLRHCQGDERLLTLL